MYALKDNENPECFGENPGAAEGCGSCRFAEACKFAFEDSRRTRTEDAKWENAGEFIENLSPARSEFPFPVDIDENRMFSHDEVVALSAFLLRIGHDRKLGKILNAKLMGVKSFAEIARKEGVTRQAIHKRIGKQLAKLFGFKERRLTDSRLLGLDVPEFSMLKLIRSGCCENEIMETLALPVKRFREMKARLEWKLSCPT